MAQLVAKAYANAFFELACETQMLDICYEKLKRLFDMIKAEEDFVRILNHTEVTKKEKMDLLTIALGEDTPNIIFGLIDVILNKNREFYLLDIISGFFVEFQDNKGIINAYVTSAVALSGLQVEGIRTKISESTKKQVNIIQNVKPSLIGGLRVRIGDTLVDCSVKKDLENIKTLLHKDEVS